MPLDVLTREKAEFLVIRERNGATYEIRLDRIDQALLAATGESLQGG
jgi:transcriptional antiterminator Rof (Rho-off)